MTMNKPPNLSDDSFDIVPAEVGSESPPPLEEPAATQPLRNSNSPHPHDTSTQRPKNLIHVSQKSLHGLLASDEVVVKHGKHFGDLLSRFSSSLRSLDWNSKVVLIAVMGMTGSGKTSFISKVTGRNDLKIGHDLLSCTQEIQVVDTQIDNHTVRFVETPGFSDTYLSDTEILEMIAEYLGAAFTQDIKLSGIIYLHPISDTRITHHATKNLEMFQKLTGESNLKNVILTTTMWDKVTPEEGAKREGELKQKFWRVLLALGAEAARHEGTAESAQNIARGLIQNKPFYLQLQHEMGMKNKALRDTAAGREIMAEIERIKEVHQTALSEVKEIMTLTSAEKNKTTILALVQRYEEIFREMERTSADERKMNEDVVKSLIERLRAENRGECVMM